MPVLLVEDDPMDRELILQASREVSACPFIYAVGTGEEALAYLEGKGGYGDRGRYPLPRLVLLDLKLPGLDGFEVLRIIKGTEALRWIPVVVLTSSAEKADCQRAYELGANGYLVKPPDFHRLKEMLEGVKRFWLKENRTPLEVERCP